MISSFRTSTSSTSSTAKKWGLGLRSKLLLFSSFLFVIPYLSYQFVWELETYLRIGQEQTLVGTARAVATALHERPALFDTQSAFLSDVRPGKDLYAHRISYPIQLDGRLSDWQDYQELTLQYQANSLLEQDEFRRYVIAPFASGWVNAFMLDNNTDAIIPVGVETRIQGQWRQTDSGYDLELRFPLSMVSSNIAFAISDVDDLNTREVKYMMGTANPTTSDDLGTVLVPSPEIESIIQGLQYSNARVWVVDNHMRVLARSGDIQQAKGISDGAYSQLSSGQSSSSQSPPIRSEHELSIWQRFESKVLLPLYYTILSKPPAEFVDELEGAFALQGQDISNALNGEPDTLWRLSSDSKAVILSAAHPIFIDNEVMGAVVVTQQTK